MSDGVVRDKDLNLEDAESSHTLVGAGQGGSHGDGSGENARGWCCASKCSATVPRDICHVTRRGSVFCFS